MHRGNVLRETRQRHWLHFGILVTLTAVRVVLEQQLMQDTRMKQARTKRKFTLRVNEQTVI